MCGSVLTLVAVMLQSLHRGVIQRSRSGEMGPAYPLPQRDGLLLFFFFAVQRKRSKKKGQPTAFAETISDALRCFSQTRLPLGQAQTTEKTAAPCLGWSFRLRLQGIHDLKRPHTSTSHCESPCSLYEELLLFCVNFSHQNRRTKFTLSIC